MRRKFFHFAQRFTVRSFSDGPSIPTGPGKGKESLRSFFAVASNEDITKRLNEFSKLHISDAQLPLVQAFLSEIAERRAGTLPARGFRDALHLAYISKNYDLALALHKGRLLTQGSDIKFTVYDTVVDSAFYLQQVETLEEIAATCHRKLSESKKEVIADFSLCRAFWRCICIAAAKKGDQQAQACFDAAARIWRHVAAISSTTLTADAAVAHTRRLILYAPDGEFGEMSFHRWCKETGALRFCSAPSDDLRCRETFYCGLIRTCRAGHFSDQARVYFDEMRSAKPGAAASDEPEDATSEEAVDIFGISTGGAAATTTYGNTTEVVLFSLLFVFTNAKEFRRVVDTGRLLAQDGNDFSPSVWAVLCVAAGETKDLAFADHAFRAACLSGRKITPFIVYSCLSALSKCHVKDFEDQYLRVCIDNGLIAHDPETYTYLILQNALGSTNPLGRAQPIITDALASKNDTGISVRVASICFKILLRTEAPEFLAFYKKIVSDCGLMKTVWLEELVLWADRRRYFLSLSEREYILAELNRVFGVSDIRGSLGGVEKLRTHIAAIQHDAMHNPLERFRESEWIAPEPQITDSRVHFIMKKKTAVNTSPSERLEALMQDYPAEFSTRDILLNASATPRDAQQAVVRHFLTSTLARVVPAPHTFSH